MKILFVTSGNGKISAFITDQENALKKKKINIDYFLIKGKGVIGYLANFKLLQTKINSFKPDIIHAHYGLSGLLSTLQRKIPVLITFHGSDINDSRIRFFSKIANFLCDKSIFVSEDLAKIAGQKNPTVIPCGVDLEIFSPMDKLKSKNIFGLKNKSYILFSSFFSNEVKNYPLAKEAISLIEEFDIELIELKGFNRDEVARLMNAVDLVLLTSFNEGSPQFIKEAMACNVPIVSTDVGDVKEVIGNTEGCYVGAMDPIEIANKIKLALHFNKKTNGREQINRFESGVIADKIIKLYKEILHK